MNLNDVTVLVITDGRGHCLERMVASARENLPWALMFQRHLINDSLDPAYASWLDAEFAGDFVIHHIAIEDGHKHGFGGAIQAGWDRIGDAKFVCHLEDDFTFNRPVPVEEICEVLAERETLAQVCLLRQPWNDAEKAAGGIIPANPAPFYWRTRWIEHRLCFSTNPCFYRGDIVAKGWPQTKHSEGIFTHRLIGEGFFFAYWGQGEEWVHHIGDERVGIGY